MRPFLLMVLAAAALAAPARAQNTNDSTGNSPGPMNTPHSKSEWELQQERRNPSDLGTALPAWPKDANLVEFWVNNSVKFKLFIDVASLSVGSDNVVRFTMVARSPSGVNNVSYEGMRCSEALYKIYANGYDGKWVARESEWRPIEFNQIQGWHHELRQRYFCPSRRGTILTAAEGVDALRRGGHPGAAARPGY